MTLNINTKSRSHGVHCLGNGKLAVYGQGINIMQVFGPPYSSPSFMKLKLSKQEDGVVSDRIKGTPIWQHSQKEGCKTIFEAVDFVDAEIPCFIRKLYIEEEIIFDLEIENDFCILNNISRFERFGVKASLLAEADSGVYIYGKYPSPKKLTNQIVVTGNIELIEVKSNTTYQIICKKGEVTIYITGGPSYPECMENMESALEAGYENMLSRTKEYWSDFTARRFDFDKKIPMDLEEREVLLKTIDDVSVLIKTQQGIDGGVLAGHNYHLAYIRDQYGTFRCLLKLGYYTEARAILNFYWNIWKRHRRLHNAQASGVDGIFHVHENDGVEITGYLIIQAFDYYKVTGDAELLKEISPMLQWAWNMQKEQLVDYMLPFNGDETYIAGGILPRNCINDGSAEATLLFITSGQRLLRWIKENEYWEAHILDENIKLLEETIKNYRKNFVEDGRIITNNPKRRGKIKLPIYRHGVCEGCNSFGWTEMNMEDRYVCPNCLQKNHIKRVEPQKYYLKSVSLMPLYIGSELFSMEEIRSMVDEIVLDYKTTGRLPSREHDTISVGYDYGLFLYTLNTLNNPLSKEIFRRMLDMLDSTGAWVEYYDKDVPKGTRYRPWESGINLEAAINYALKEKNT
jgi:hypothetical protein